MSEAMIKITALTTKARRGLSSLEKDQFPFALAKTLTQIAGFAVVAVQLRTAKAFKLHGAFIPRGVARTSAKKSDIRAKGIGTTIIYTKPLISGFMPIHEAGGTRTPVSSNGADKGKALAQPARTLKTKSYRTGTGKVRARWKLSTLLAGYVRRKGKGTAGRVQSTTRGGRKGKAFIIRAKGSGTPMVVRRKAGARYPLELLYVFSKRAKYKPVWRFETTVQDVVDKLFERTLAIQLKAAVASAR